MMYTKAQEPQLKRWTNTAIECYERKCICEGCPLSKMLESRCRMKKTVIALVRQFGVPEKLFNELLPGITQSENDVIKAILDGANTKNEIAEKLEMQPDSIQYRLGNLYVIAENQGKIFKRNKDKLPEFIEWIRDKLKGEKMYDKDLDLEYANYFGPIVDAVKKGYTQLKEIADLTQIKSGTLSVHFDNFFKYLVSKNLINYSKINTSKRQAIVDFIQARLLDLNAAMKNKNNELVLEQEKEEEKILIMEEQPNAIKLYSEQDYNELQEENKKLKKRIEELENHPPEMNFCKIKQKIAEKIAHLQDKLKTIEALEQELLEEQRNLK